MLQNIDFHRDRCADQVRYDVEICSKTNSFRHNENSGSRKQK